MSDRDVLACIIDEQAFSKDAEERIARGLASSARQEDAYRKVDEILEYILARVETAKGVGR